MMSLPVAQPMCVIDEQAKNFFKDSCLSPNILPVATFRQAIIVLIKVLGFTI